MGVIGIASRTEYLRYQAGHSFPCGSSTPAHARRWSLARIEEALAQDGSGGQAVGPDVGQDAVALLDDAALIVSELVTNAVRAGCGQTEVNVAIDERQVRIAVVDDAPGVPARLDPSTRDDHGRGLHIVAAVASEWGVTPVGDGKEVWAALPLTQGTRREPITQGVT